MLWNKQLETGVEQIDDQHKELCRLVDSITDHDQDTKVEDTVAFLGNYVVRHFSDEEGLQAASGYPELPGHKQLHANFIDAFLSLMKELTEADDEEALQLAVMTINSTVVEWLRDHIMVHDRRFAEYYKVNA